MPRIQRHTASRGALKASSALASAAASA